MAPEGFSFPRSSRLTRRSELQTVLQNGKRVRSKLLELHGLASHSRTSARIGLIVPKHRHNAVQRNRLKRRLREILRLHFLSVLSEVELVVRTLPAAYSASREELQAELEELVPKLVQRKC